MASYTYLEAQDFLMRKVANFERNLAIIIDKINAENVQEVKNKLIFNFGEEELVSVENNGETQEIAIKDIENAQKITVNPASFTERKTFTFGDLLEIIRRLRDPDGCPWDRAQTNESIRNNAIEEAYELAEAVDVKDREKMVEESGDVLLQGLFHASIAEENGFFTPVDVLNGICYKLVSRHTHIFGENKANNPEDALKFWEQAKAVEKSQKSIADKIDSVPVTFGALMKANKVQKIIKKTGFDFACVEDAEKKIFEELNELHEATTDMEREKEAGDLLFAVVNVLRMMDIDPELALSGSTNRFASRFKYVESKAKEIGLVLCKENINRMEELYQQAKKLEN